MNRMEKEVKWNCCGCWNMFFQNDMLLVNGGSIDMEEPDWWCHGCLDEETGYLEYCPTCWNDSPEDDTRTHRSEEACPTSVQTELDVRRREVQELAKMLFNANQELLGRKKHTRRLGRKLGFVQSERDRLINKLANINENWEKWQHQYLKLQEENRKLQEEADCFSETFIVYSAQAEEKIEELEKRLARSEETVRMHVDATRSLQDRLDHLAETKDRRELALEQRIERAETETEQAWEHLCSVLRDDLVPKGEQTALEAENVRLREALALISKVPAFPSKDIADKALDVQGPDWEPRAVREYRERKDGQD